MRRTMTLVALTVMLGCGWTCDRSSGTGEAVAAGPVTGSTPSADGTAIAYTVTGEGSPALVFIHGWMCDQTFWSGQVPAFSSQHKVVTVDLAGHGESGRDRSPWTLASLGEDVRAVIEHLALDRAILVGHSMGGPTALAAARLMPERVIGVVGVDTLQDPDLKWDPEELAGMIATMEADFVASCDGFVRAMFPADAGSLLADQVSQSMCSGPPEIGIALMRGFGDYDQGAAMEAVDVPVRCINCDLWPTSIDNNRKYLADFDAVIMEGVGHFLMQEDPATFNTHLAAVIGELEGAHPVE